MTFRFELIDTFFERSKYKSATMHPREINSAEVELDVARPIQRLKRVVFVILSHLCCVVFNFSRCGGVLIVYFHV